MLVDSLTFGYWVRTQERCGHDEEPANVSSVLVLRIIASDVVAEILILLMKSLFI